MKQRKYAHKPEQDQSVAPATAKWLQSRPFQPDTPQISPVPPQAEPTLSARGFDLTRLPGLLGQGNTDPRSATLPRGLPLQAKLTIGAPGDKYEQEADRVADQVVQSLNRDTIQRVESTVTIEDVTDEEETNYDQQQPQEIPQPSTPLMLTDVPWSEVEARQDRERQERREQSQIDDPRYQQKLKEISPKAPTEIGKLGTPNPALTEHFQGRSLENFQTVDPRYQNKLKEISPKAPAEVGKLGVPNPALTEHFQDHSLENFQSVDPRYQNKLKEISPKAPTEIGKLPEGRKQMLQDAFIQDRKNQMERALKKEEEARKLTQLKQAQETLEATRKVAKAKMGALIPEDQEELKGEQTYKDFSTAKVPKDPLEGCQAKLAYAQYVLKWATKRLSRRSLLKQLQGEIAKTSVVGRFKDVFTTQAQGEYTNIERLVLTSDRQGVIQVQTTYREAIKNLATAHKQVHDLDQKGGKYGLNSLLVAVEGVISSPTFSVTRDQTRLDEAIQGFNEAFGKLSNSLQGRMKNAQQAENKLTSYSTTGQDPRGKTEEDKAVKEINTLFTETQEQVKNQDTGITNPQVSELQNAAKRLDSYQDRTKERQAFDMKEKYEKAPYHLDPNTSKIVHAERHQMKGSTGYKSALELEKDYKNEVDLQYKASKEQWCKHLGYTAGTGGSRVRENVGNYDGVKGHHTLFIGPYTDIVNAKDKNASDPTAVDKSADELMAVLYPSSGVTGAHYSLEFADPKPHAYRGGPTIPGSKYQVDKQANNDTWQAAKTYMEQQQTQEETRVRGKIQDALNDHMKVIHRKDPNRRK
jgi:hypothetical protein